MTPGYEQRNRAFWDADADDYQAVHGGQLARGRVWGAWAIPDADLEVLGDIRGLDILELGCGGAQWAIALAGDASRIVGLDQSRAQLRHAAANVAARDRSVPLLCASGERLPLRDASFDLVFCDHGAMSFCDPDRSVPEVARLLRPGGRLVFNKATMLHSLCYDETAEALSPTLQRPYFDSRVHDSEDGTIDFHLQYGEWIRLLRAHGFEVEDLVELRPPPDATTTYGDFVVLGWARAWPAEEIWVTRKSWDRTDG